MKRRDLMGLVGLTMVPSWAWAVPATEDPYTWIVNLSNRVLDKIRANPALKSGDTAALQALVESDVMPDVDFAVTTRLAVGPAWRQATPEQKKELQELFKQLLIRVYSGALNKVGDHVCQLPPGRLPAPSPDMEVRVNLVSKKDPTVQMGYRVYENKAHEWKVVDLNVEGIWLAQNYHDQFQGLLNQGGIPALIEALQKKVNA